MNKLTALFAALLAFALMTGISMAADMTGGEKSSVAVANELGKQLAPRVFGTGYFTDGVSHEELSGTIDIHYGVAPEWEGKPEENLTMIENTENVLRNHLSPNAFGIAYSADGVSDEVFRGAIDTHYGVAPDWEGRTEEPLKKIDKVERELWEQLAPREIYRKDVF